MAQVVESDAAQARPLRQLVEPLSYVCGWHRLSVLAGEHETVVDVAVAPLHPFRLLLEPRGHQNAEGAPVQVDDARLARRGLGRPELEQPVLPRAERAGLPRAVDLDELLTHHQDAALGVDVVPSEPAGLSATKPCHRDNEVRWTAKYAREDAAIARPTFDPNSAADLTRTEQAWRNVVLPQPEKGRNLAEVLRSADRDAVLGTERFAPACLAAHHTTAGKGLIPQTPDHTATVRSMASRRLAELVDGDRKSEAILAGDRVDAEVEAFEHIANLVDRGGNNLEAAITAHYASQPASADDTEDAA